MKQALDVVIVGSGATGGWVAKELGEAGLKVVVLEAGPRVDPARFTTHMRPYDSELRGIRSRGLKEKKPIQSLCYACTDYNEYFFIDDAEHPYSTPDGKPFWWIRCRVVGGRSNVWGRMTYRYSDLDFKAASQDGVGENWPLSYHDLQPYYDKVERYIGVSGAAENLPQLPDGLFLPPMGLTCGEQLLKKAVDHMGRRLTIGRVAMLTRPHNGRPACHYCGECERGCDTNSFYASTLTTLEDGLRTGNVELRTNCIVSHIAHDDENRAKSVHYVDRITRAQQEISAPVIVLCASTMESTRILLNSRSPRFPSGLGNSSGVLGHYLMDHVKQGGASGYFPQLANRNRERIGKRNNGIFIPRFRNLTKVDSPFLRGYGFEGESFQSEFDHATSIPGFGVEFKRRVRQEVPWNVRLYGYGECLPRIENRMELRPDLLDAWGIPSVHIVTSWSDNEVKLVQDMGDAAAEMIEAAGGVVAGVSKTPSVFGFANHQVGAARMGNNPKTSYLNRFCQSHDVKNLFIMDGSCFVTSAWANPTLTMMALAVRSCDYLKEEYRKGNLK
ncbi:MAG TPA: GMC family oxidoreductase [Acidobacteriota bacterium]|jgi:choline dehydrogenase-like flavoprotein